VNLPRNRNIRQSILLLGLAIFLLTTIGPPQATAQKSQVQPKKEEVPKNPDLGNFTYSSENRRDPFEPVYLQKMKETKERTGVVKSGYELEELKLVGIVRADNGKYAMMEDIQGKGILFKKGDFLNSNLWIEEVQEGKVLLAYKTKRGTRSIVMDIAKK
jgi:Tfp pilus assembly protein PilP